MFMKIHKRMKGEKGFTLIELLVVIIIIAILAAIAIPTFLGQRQKAQDASAKSLVRNAMTALESAYVDARTYAVADTVIEAIEPSIDFAVGATGICDGTAVAPAATSLAEQAIVSYFGAATTFEIATLSASGNAFGVFTDKGAGGSTIFCKIIDGVFSTGW
jgi:type IV pilus assembly protein PilA